MQDEEAAKPVSKAAPAKPKAAPKVKAALPKKSAPAKKPAKNVAGSDDDSDAFVGDNMKGGDSDDVRHSPLWNQINQKGRKVQQTSI